MDEWDEEEKAVRQLLEEAGPRPPIPQEDLDAISAAARLAWRNKVQNQAPAPARRHFRAYAAALAAALVVTVGLAVWWALRSGGPEPVTVARVEAVAGAVHLERAAGEARGIAAGETVLAGAALRSGEGRASLRLADGATVRLDVETRLRFLSAAVLELERGALYVDTGPGPHRGSAVVVQTPFGTARDVGTRFAVRIAKDGGPALLVRVRDGAVLTERSGRTHLTRAGQELALQRDGASESREAAPYGAEWDWVLAASPGFDIEGRSLGELLDWVSHETGWRITFADEGLAASAPRIILHGGIGQLRPDQAPFAVLPGAGLEGELQDGTLVVRLRR